MGIGCRRDPLEANVWYVKAAEHGDQRAVARLKVIHEAASGSSPPKKSKKKEKEKEKAGDKPRVLEKKQHQEGDEKDCVIM